jgi:coenzyme PQQ synthesis protein D (PqqD)
MGQLYRVDVENIMHETIDGEVVIVNLETGTYYAFDGTGEFIWNQLSGDGASLEQLIDAACRTYQGSQEEISAGVSRFFNALQKEKMLISTDGIGSTAPTFELQVSTDEFELPKLNIYTDMEALLLADPIHEVESDGWPNLK